MHRSRSGQRTLARGGPRRRPRCLLMGMTSRDQGGGPIRAAKSLFPASVACAQLHRACTVSANCGQASRPRPGGGCEDRRKAERRVPVVVRGFAGGGTAQKKAGGQLTASLRGRASAPSADEVSTWRKRHGCGEAPRQRRLAQRRHMASSGAKLSERPPSSGRHRGLAPARALPAAPVPRHRAGDVRGRRGRVVRKPSTWIGPRDGPRWDCHHSCHIGGRLLVVAYVGSAVHSQSQGQEGGSSAHGPSPGQMQRPGPY